MENRKFYVCHVNNCKFNEQGSCIKDIDVVTIALYDGVAQCPNYEEEEKYPLDSHQEVLAKALLTEIKNILLDIGDPLEEDLSQFELCTDIEHVCFMRRKDSNYMQDFSCNESVAALVDAYNTVINGLPLHCKMVD